MACTVSPCAAAGRRSSSRASLRHDRFGLVALLVALAAGALPAAQAADPYRATSSREARAEATAWVPYDRLTPDGQAKVGGVLANVSVYRRMPVQVFRCDPKLYLFMVEHPDVTVNLWEVLGVTQAQLRRTGENSFHAVDGAGTEGDVEFLYRSPELHLVWATGSYTGSLFHKPVRGACLLLLRTGYVREPDGNYYITSQLDAFFNLEHLGLEIIAKTFQPLVGKSADYNFIESTNFLSTLSRTAELRPAVVEQLALRLNHVRPEDRQQFAAITAAIGQAAPRLAAPVPQALVPHTPPRGP